MRGISLASIPSSDRICSARMPRGRFSTSVTISPSAFWMSSCERRLRPASPDRRDGPVSRLGEHDRLASLRDLAARHPLQPSRLGDELVERDLADGLDDGLGERRRNLVELRVKGHGDANAFMKRARRRGVLCAGAAMRTLQVNAHAADKCVRCRSATTHVVVRRERAADLEAGEADLVAAP